MAETDPELGANCKVLFCRAWDELLEVPDLDRLVEGLNELIPRLKVADANQYRVFRFDKDGAILAAFVFLRMDKELSQVTAETLALSQGVQTILLWSDTAFRAQAPLASAGERTILRPDIATLVRAAYDPVLPAMAQDKSFALRLFARMEAPQ